MSNSSLSAGSPSEDTLVNTSSKYCANSAHRIARELCGCAKVICETRPVKATTHSVFRHDTVNTATTKVSLVSCLKCVSTRLKRRTRFGGVDGSRSSEVIISLHHEGVSGVAQMTLFTNQLQKNSLYDNSKTTAITCFSHTVASSSASWLTLHRTSATCFAFPALALRTTTSFDVTSGFHSDGVASSCAGP